MITFHRLKTKTKNQKNSKPKHTRLKYDLEKLKDFNVLETYQAKIGGKLVPLTIMSNDDTNIDTMITTFNTAVVETASSLANKVRRKNPGSLQKLLICVMEEEN